MADSTGLNKEYFDKEAANYDNKHAKALEDILNKIRARRDFIGVDWVDEDDEDSSQDNQADGAAKSVRLLDYACGTGNFSRALAPYTTQCVGIDLSEGMVGTYNTRARNQGLSRDEMYAYHGNLCRPEDPDPAAFTGPEFFGFDVAAVGLGFHHFDDPDLAARRLAARLRPGGVLAIVDFMPHGVDQYPNQHHHHHDAGAGDGDGHVHQSVSEGLKTVVHHGFSEERIREVFEGAGVGAGFGILEIGTIKLENASQLHGRTMFIARGTKS